MKYQWVVLSVTTVGIFMAGLDTRIVLVGLPTIGMQLHSDLETLLWMTQGYQFATTIGLLFLGWFTDVFGRVKIYNLGFAVFTIGSALCGFSQTGAQLIAFRVIQGTGASMLIANSAAIITDATPPEQLGLLLGVNFIANTIGAVFGLTVGGILITLVGWQSIFFVNIPFGIFGTAWAYLRLKELSKGKKRPKFDLLGLTLFTVGLTVLLLGITFVTSGALSSAAFAVLLVFSFAFLGLFVYVETHHSEPILDMKLFRIRAFSAGILSQLLFSLGFGAQSLIIILYLQLVRGLSPLNAGLAFIPLDVSFSAVGAISGRLSDRYGARGFTTLGLSLGALGYFLLSLTITVNSSITVIEAILVLIGGGLGFFASPNVSSIMGSVPAERRGVASAIRATIFNAGGVVSIGMVAAIVTTAIPYSTVSQILIGGITSLSTADALGFVEGIRRAFLVAALLTLPAAVASSFRGSKRPQNETIVKGSELTPV